MENNMIAVVNPITRVATILHKYNDCVYEEKIWFKDLDEWSGFETDKAYDVHFHYDEVFEFYISEYDNRFTHLGMVDVYFFKDVVYNDYDYHQAVTKHTLKLQGNEQTQES
jgi:hypothetical protein